MIGQFIVNNLVYFLLSFELGVKNQMLANKKKLGEILRYYQKISGPKLKSGLDQQKLHGGRLGEILVSRGFISEQDLLNALQEQYQIPIIDFAKAPRNPKALQLVSQNFATNHLILPITFIQISSGLILVVAMEDPGNKKLIKHLNDLTGFPIKPMLAGKFRIIQAIAEAYRSDSPNSSVAYL